MNAELFITNISFGISIAVCFGLGILVFIRRPKEGGASNTLLFLASMATVIWQLSYVIGINIYDPHLSQLVFMFNLSTMFLMVMFSHLVLVVSNRLKKIHRITILVMYVVATLITIFYIFFPETFLLPSKPILYFPNFFVPGSLYEIQDSFFFIVFFYMFTQLFISYHRADYQMRNRLKYFIVAYIWGFGAATVADFLLYGINIDPFVTSLTGLYTIPMAYAIIKYDALDLNILAKRAFGSALTVGVVTGSILLIGYANDYVTQAFPDFPGWALPLFSGIVAVFIGLIAWNRIREVDVLKYQFIDVVTHKFRTPITHIRWSVDNLKTPQSDADRAESLEQISGAATRLYELTDSLIGISSADDSQYLYTFTAESVSECVKSALDAASGRLLEKKVTTEVHIADDLPKIYVDRKKFQFVVQMIVENAIVYSPSGSKVIIGAEHKGGQIVISIQDFGIGISKEDRSRLFSKFFRSTDAMHAHTEGLGVGLYLSRDIMKRTGGDLTVESEGVGKGSTFFVKAPVVK